MTTKWLNALQPNDFISSTFCKLYVQSIDSGNLNPQLLAVEQIVILVAWITVNETISFWVVIVVADQIMVFFGVSVVAKCGDISEEHTASIFRETWLKIHVCTEGDLRFSLQLLTIRIVAACSSEMLLHFYQITHRHRSGVIKSYICTSVFQDFPCRKLLG